MAKPDKGHKKAPNKYEATINLRETAMPARGDLAHREPEILATWERDRLYQRILEARAGAPRFVLHDGPPYSNGSIHYGHILNKILKDIVVKYKTLAGFRAPYVPGWDTHGLPIELAVERELGGRRAGMSVADVRKACRDYALRFVDIQRNEFKRLGVLGDWDHPYLTLEPSYERAIVRALAAFARAGSLYRGKKPVYWCPRDGTALAEAEIEYKDKSSPSIYVRCPSDVDPAQLDPRLAGKRLALPIWTTTPWTLPANLAIVLGPHIDYVVVPSPKDAGEVLIVAAALAENFVQAIGGTWDPATAVAVEQGKIARLEGSHYQHPFCDASVSGTGDAAFRVWFADYVTVEQGTGLVHTAPGHGVDDYRTGAAHGLPPYAPVDDRGRFTAEVPHWAGQKTDEANPKIVQHLADTGFLLNPVGDKVQHSYPHCWRCKGPILFRATPQWFLAIDHDGLRGKALAEIERTTWVPPWGKNRIYAMIEGRPDWVLSRQRLWGVPIPTFYCRACGGEHLSADTIEHVAEVFGRDGSDAWWTKSVAELLPAGTTCGQCGAAGAEAFEREKDIVDVWFESGASWLAMRDHAPDHEDIDVYLEGSDQHRGWFHSSLLTAIGVQGKAPYKTVITHGFVLDELGAPYSKSAIEQAKAAGKKVSYIPPEDVIKMGGVELFRLWVASTEFRNDIPYSKAILDGLSEWYRKYRNSARFLLSNLMDFDPDKGQQPIGWLDGLMDSRIDDFVAGVRRAYDDFEFHVAHRLMVEFVTLDLSAFYCDIVKDRLYAEPTDKRERRSAQAVLYKALRAITLLAAPVLCFTADDVWQHMPRMSGDPDSVHMALAPSGQAWPNVWQYRDDFEVLKKWRSMVNAALEPFRAAKHKSTDAHVTLHVHASSAQIRLFDTLAQLGELADLFIVSGVDIDPIAPTDSERITVREHGGARCERCWRWYAALAADPTDVCERCAGALAALRS